MQTPWKSSPKEGLHVHKGQAHTCWLYIGSPRLPAFLNPKLLPLPTPLSPLNWIVLDELYRSYYIEETIFINFTVLYSHDGNLI